MCWRTGLLQSTLASGPVSQDSHPKSREGVPQRLHCWQALDFNMPLLCFAPGVCLKPAEATNTYPFYVQRAAVSMTTPRLPQLGSHQDKDKKLVQPGGHCHWTPQLGLLSPEPHCACGHLHKWVPWALPCAPQSH